MGLAPLQSAREAFAARETTIAVGLFLVVMNGGYAVLEQIQHGEVHWAYIAHAMVAALVTFVLWRHPTTHERWSLAAFVALVLPMIPILWVFSTRTIAAGMVWPVFTTMKLLALGLAVFTPSAAVAAALLLLFLVEWILLWSRSPLMPLPVIEATGEPWTTLLYFAAALLLVALRWRNVRLERLLTAAELEAHTSREVMQISAAIRDRLGTPLQNLELSIAALKARHPEEQPTLDRMARSLRRLVELRPLSEAAPEVARLRALLGAAERLERLEPQAGASESRSSAIVHGSRRPPSSRPTGAS